MKYTLEERLEIGRRIYEDEISKIEAKIKNIVDSLVFAALIIMQVYHYNLL